MLRKGDRTEIVNVKHLGVLRSSIFRVLVGIGGRRREGDNNNRTREIGGIANSLVWRGRIISRGGGEGGVTHQTRGNIHVSIRLKPVTQLFWNSHVK